MNIKKILLISLILVSIVVSVNVVNAGLFDGLFVEEPQDNVIHIGKISFNSTNASDFKKVKEESTDYTHTKFYNCDNGSGEVFVNIMDFSKLGDQTYLLDNSLNEYKKMPSQTINGVIVYTQSVTTGDNVGKPAYTAMVRNDDLKKLVAFGSPDPNETAKMALSVKFK